MKRLWNALMDWAEILAQYRRNNKQPYGYY